MQKEIVWIHKGVWILVRQVNVMLKNKCFLLPFLDVLVNVQRFLLLSTGHWFFTSVGLFHLPLLLHLFLSSSLYNSLHPGGPLWVSLMLLSSWVLDLISRDLPTEEAQQGGPCFYNERADKAKAWHPPRDRFGQIEAETDRARERGEKKTHEQKADLRKKKYKFTWDAEIE